MSERYKHIIENYIKSYNAFNIPGMTRDLHGEVVFENLTNGQVDLSTKGIVEFRKQAESAKAYFSERQQSVKSWVFDENTVKVEIEYQATLAIDLPNEIKAGDTIQLTGQSVFELKPIGLSKYKT